MNTKKSLILFAVTLLVSLAFTSSAVAEQYVTGIVYNDSNRNGVKDSDEAGIKGVRVSNGSTSVKTDRGGKYRMTVSDDAVIFVIKPRNWMTRLDTNNVPRFYYIHKPKGSPDLKYKGTDPTGPLPASVDFPLYPHKETNTFSAVFLGDTQVNSVEDISYLAHDIIEELIGTDSAFCVSLGDVVNNNLSLYGPLLPVMGKIGIPCYYVKGNHDTNYDGAPDEKAVKSTFERVVSASYYSFDYGPVHFVAINNPYFAFTNIYSAKLDAQQMAFLRDDLASIPKKQLVVLMMHIPINEMSDRKEIYELLKSHPNTFSISAHTHTQAHRFFTKTDGWNGDKPHHHMVSVTSCGSWWNGLQDEVGIPHTTMRDGAPNGYSIITFKGSSYSIRFKAARRPDNYQMNIYAPDTVEANKAGETEVLANIFAGSERSKVEMRVGEKGNWIPMELLKVEDPAYVAVDKMEIALRLAAGKRLPKPVLSTHIWKADLPGNLSAGTYAISVRTTDMFKQTYESSRLINIRQ